jgi:transposase-like protein
MDYQEILLSAKNLSAPDQARLVSDLLGLFQENYLSFRRQQLYNKQSCCPRCESNAYYKYGIDKGVQRFKCKVCFRTFTEFTGTWLDGLHLKTIVPKYFELMIEGKSLDKISKILNINKKTAFDWRHKILSSLCQNTGNEMSGIIESDETFFERSEKGSRNLERPARKRGSSNSLDKGIKSNKRGISNNKAAVIATADRQGGMSLCVAAMGRISKESITCSIAGKLPANTILCTDGHVSYKGFARDNKLEHIVLRADLKQHVKQGVYHIQNINSIHNRLKKWINNTFWGVSTKYLQNYLGWFHMNEKLKGSASNTKDFILKTLQNTDAMKQYRYIDVSYNWLLATQY